ncbi:Homeobox domain [Carpediemonas membranifera]|uniref:Homeobox domain n=1 Tax=Carpediemonas membranifera TaxID=201153 RepID=A0A8J6AXE3_9EUKA|nr:Homeobox domain [Carpediemonas membranifera]|eukprot:KAG9397216.1 Homeobox domain [Carpediemonas membranifera]
MSDSTHNGSDIPAIGMLPLFQALPGVENAMFPPKERSAEEILANIEQLSNLQANESNNKSQKGSTHRGFNLEQLAVLVACFRLQCYPSREEIGNIAQYTGLDVLKVRTWFQNSRTRGVSDCPAADAVDAQRILDGTIPDPAFVVRKTVPESESWTQCTSLPSELMELYDMGVLDAMLGVVRT